MSDPAKPCPGLQPRSRVQCSVAAVLCATLLNVGLLMLFHQSSSERWLNPTPQLLQAKALCDTLPAREARTRCTQELVARALTPGLRTAQLSSR